MNDLMRLALGYAPRRSREALKALWTLDDALGRIVATTTEPLIGQMRLTWWHEQLVGLDTGNVPAEPILCELARSMRDHGVTSTALASLVEGWEVLLEPLPLSDDQLRGYATLRGERLFALSSQITRREVSTGLGAGWALIDFAARCSERITRERAMALFAPAPIKGAKPLRILAHVAKSRAQQSSDQIMMPVSRWIILRAVLS